MHTHTSSHSHAHMHSGDTCGDATCIVMHDHVYKYTEVMHKCMGAQTHPCTPMHTCMCTHTFRSPGPVSGALVGSCEAVEPPLLLNVALVSYSSCFVDPKADLWQFCWATISKDLGNLGLRWPNQVTTFSAESPPPFGFQHPVHTCVYRTNSPIWAGLTGGW